MALLGNHYDRAAEVVVPRLRNNTISVVMVNAAAVQFAQNLLCSLARNGVPLDSLVIFPLDFEARDALRDLWHSEYSFQGSSTRQRMWGEKLGWGMLWDPRWIARTTRLVSWGDKDYQFMMQQRPTLLIDLLQGLQVDVIFMDADIVFTEDPIPLLQDPLKSGLADLSVSLDTRKTLRNSTDPYEGQHAVPFACGGFFYARSNARTIRYFRDMRNLLEEPRWFATDQTAAYALLNQAGRVSLVGEVPAALQLRPGINVDKQIARRLIAPQGGRVLPPVERSAGKETVLSVRILDNERWINGAAMTASPWHNSTVTMMHFNVPPEFMPKLSYIQKVHAWYLDDKGHCMK
eukprot:jgi/Chrzof1/9312/UNPLg00281.t1